MKNPVGVTAKDIRFKDDEIVISQPRFNMQRNPPHIFRKMPNGWYNILQKKSTKGYKSLGYISPIIVGSKTLGWEIVDKGGKRRGSYKLLRQAKGRALQRLSNPRTDSMTYMQDNMGLTSTINPKRNKKTGRFVKTHKKKRNSTVRLHRPKTISSTEAQLGRHNPRNQTKKWWRTTVYNTKGRVNGHYISQGTTAQAKKLAAQKANSKGVARAVLNGPYKNGVDARKYIG